MMRRHLKLGCFILEGLNAFATSYYYNYLFFYLQRHLGFSRMANLALCALGGLLYTVAARGGGRFAQKHGCFSALRLGFAVMGVSLLVGAGWPTVTGQVVVLLGWTFGMCFTWPALEALVSEGETWTNLARLIGIYNVVWAGASFLGYFWGGALLEKLGWSSLYWLPASVHLVQIIFATWFARAQIQDRFTPHPPPTAVVSDVREAAPPSAKVFLQMAWVANPFSYIAINTVIPLIPDLATQLHLSPMFAGFFCSIWFFVRLIAFVALWRWQGWHYRFGWLLGAYLAIIVSFATLLLVPQLAVIIAAQVLLGFGVGLTYYSSLFYSMHVGDTKGEHGGFHESAIGAGICSGPACGAAALFFFPDRANSGTWAVSGLLVLGLLVLLLMKRRGLAKPALVPVK